MGVLKFPGGTYDAFFEITKCSDGDFLVSIDDGRGNKATIDIANPINGGGPKDIWNVFEEIFWSKKLEKYRRLE